MPADLEPLTGPWDASNLVGEAQLLSRIEEALMRPCSWVCGVLLATAAIVAQLATVQAAGAIHVEFSIAGDTLACPDATYTVQSGSIREVVREGESGSGNTMFTVTDVPHHVVLTDAAGATYSLRGAIWFGGATNDRTGAEVITATHMLTIVGRGGVADSIRLVEIFRDGVLVSHEFGTCEG
jgi:hypothetical protein